MPALHWDQTLSGSRYWWDSDGYRISVARGIPRGAGGARADVYAAWQILGADEARRRGFPVGARASTYACALGTADTFDGAAALCEAHRTEQARG